MDDPTPPVPDRFDHMHWVVRVVLLVLSVGIVIFWLAVALTLLAFREPVTGR
ncbi:hypothetical protein [Halorientalis sp. IM1011]|uniref:hypothetical protein n=1 Tax=Halorientalis sp. IM1011 TaxID=1932360 RepID=UPI0012F88174|nr:hypothetical protein [Halorientalis sp. IM1011]